MPSESRNLPEQELSIKARSHELYFQPPHQATTKPFPAYLRETPAAPLSTFTKVVLWIVGIIVALLFVAALWRAALGHGPRRQTRAPRPTADVKRRATGRAVAGLDDPTLAPFRSTRE